MAATSAAKNRSCQSPIADAFLNQIAESFDKGGFFDLGHPLLNRIAESFVKAAGIGAIQAVSREAYLTAIESVNGDSTTGNNTEIGAPKRNQRFPDL
ncbi:outer envelope pore protein 16-2, chloroplastic [Dorcoceras hygrometricum]|uniref:Outer envelope pore protein 16-2, chloroplastic n=1 Tax=Dorcoceras hygrometricum TaxID=472368 RepID=A0A2Z7C392_9LAMI|nr:outer envelope pore protein 16-2, chloroplastic [Dorcoceras hygrometricum]